MPIEIRYIERTCLQKDAFMKMIKKYHKLNHNIRVVFDLRINSYGSHWWDGNKKIHIIRINPLYCKFHHDENNPKGVRLGPVAEKYRIIGTTLHELRHAQQKEELGYKFYQEKYESVKAITNPYVATWYSECERDARIYEDEHIEDAVTVYDSACEKQ